LRVPVVAADLTRTERIEIMAGVLLSLLLGALDQTIVSTAGPAIQRDLRMPASLYPWITTSYLVASTVMVPIYGKLSDLHGRKPILLVGIVLFLLGSLLCGLAPSTMWLIAFRTVQGLGAAALFTTAFAVIADLFPPAERGRYTGLVSGVWGLASVVGPLVGGFITDAFGWHWVFFINLPLGAVALGVVVRKMPRLGGHARGERPQLDVPGVVWLVTGVVPLLVALSLGRTEPVPGEAGFAWTSWPILSMLAVALAGVVLFVRAERRAPQPLLDLRLLRHRVIGLGVSASFVLGAGFLSAIVFLPLYLVNVLGVSATSAGLTMTPLTLGMVVGSIGTGQIVSKIGRYRTLLVSGLALLVAAFVVMGFTLETDSTSGGVTLRMILLGLGMGPTLPLYTLIVQNAAPAREVGVVTAAVTFSRSLGQVIGVAVFGTVFATVLAHAIARESATATAALPPAAHRLVLVGAAGAPAVGGEGSTATVALDTAAARARIHAAAAAGTVTPAERDAALGAVDDLATGFAAAFTHAIRRLYQVGIVVVLLALLLTLAIPDLPLRRDHAPAPPIME
jgi:EmrB/QacA subfamily drug resistance transporter